MSNNFTAELQCARTIALEAGAYQKTQQPHIQMITLKGDLSPVTEVDRHCEQIIRAALLKSFPDDSILGEEFGKTEGTSGRTWIIDPLDGTRPYIKGIPTYSVLISLEVEGHAVVGVVYLPAMDELYHATKGGGAFCNDTPIKVSSTTELSRAMGSVLGLTECSHREIGEQTLELFRSIDYHYGFMDAYSYMCTASGKNDFTIGLIDCSWDRSAPSIVIKEAGGMTFDCFGTDTVYNGTFIGCTPKIAAQIQEFYQSKEKPSS